MAPRGFEVSLSKHTTCELLNLGPAQGELLVRGFYMLGDCFLVGIFEGALAYYGYEGEVLVRFHSAHDSDYLLRW